MASATGIPQRVPDAGNRRLESEPLLGGPGDATQKEDARLVNNLWLGTGWIAQVGALLLLVIVWVPVFRNQLIPLFSPHPLLQTLGVFTLTQAILIVQPTRTGEGKFLGARAHAYLNLLSFLIFAAGVGVIEANKVRSGNGHFASVHGYLGVATAAMMALQYLVGFLMYGVPAVFGGIDGARSLYKYHRWCGYSIYLLLLATVATSVRTGYNENVLGIKMWTMIVAVVLIVIGAFPRISLMKLGLRRSG